MEEIIPCAVQDREVFRRVWERVMAGRDDGDCPIEAIPANMEGDLSCACLEALTQQNQMDQTPETLPEQTMEEPAEMAPDQAGWENNEQAAEETAAEEAAPEPSVNGGAEAESGELPAGSGPHRGNDLPRLWEEPQETPERSGRMRRQVMDALEGWQFYRYLARRARGNDARVLNAMAGDIHRAARKLAAAYFLLTGLRYWPSELLGAPTIPSYWGALRSGHQAEQRREMDYRISADDWDDPDQQELYRDLGEGAQTRQRQLRALLEGDHTT